MLEEEKADATRQQNSRISLRFDSRHSCPLGVVILAKPGCGEGSRWKTRDRTELNQEFSYLIPLEPEWEYKKI